jgi:hypothetical protein
LFRRSAALLMPLLLLACLPLHAGSYFAYSTNGKSPGLRVYSTSARAIATGHGLLALNNGYVLDINNLAAWSQSNFTQFTFAFAADYYRIETGGLENEWYQFRFADAAINFPIIDNKWNFGIGLAPLTNSTVGFKVTGDIGSVIQRFRGSFVDGYLTSSFLVTGKLRLGTGFVLTFGNLTDEFKVITDSELFLNNFTTSFEYRARVPNLALSFAYEDTVFHASGQAIIPFSGDITEAEIGPSSQPGEIVYSMQLPYRFSGALGLELTDYRIGISGQYENWEDGYRIDERAFTSDLTDYLRLGVGFESKGSKRRFATAWERIAWRFGLHTAILNNRDNYSVINEYGVHTGFGLPFDTNFSSFDLGIEVGVRGDKDINLARETYVRLSFSLSTGERWFTGFDD